MAEIFLYIMFVILIILCCVFVHMALDMQAKAPMKTKTSYEYKSTYVYHKPLHERITELVFIPLAIALLLGEKLNIIEYITETKQWKWKRK